MVERGRYQLDYRHPAVIERMDSIINRLVNEFGAGYFKFDYNIDVTQGTDINSIAPATGCSSITEPTLPGLIVSLMISELYSRAVPAVRKGWIMLCSLRIQFSPPATSGTQSDTPRLRRAYRPRSHLSKVRLGLILSLDATTNEGFSLW